MKILDFLERLPEPMIAAAGVVLVVLVWVLDYLTGREISFSIFYVAPIVLVTWYEGRNAGFLVSLICALAWLTADMLGGREYSYIVIPYWNALVRLGFFLIIAFSLSRLKHTFGLERSLARTDPLTGLMNMRAFEEMAGLEISRSLRYGHPLSVAYMDCDNFKNVNDRFGHQAGSELLARIGRMLKENMRDTDLAARFGGDEFIMLFPETGRDPAMEIVKRLNEKLLEDMRSGQWHVTFSIGIVCYSKPPGSLDEIIKRADDLMYSVKFNGKNNIKIEVSN